MYSCDSHFLQEYEEDQLDGEPVDHPGIGAVGIEDDDDPFIPSPDDAFDEQHPPYEQLFNQRFVKQGPLFYVKLNSL